MIFHNTILSRLFFRLFLELLRPELLEIGPTNFHNRAALLYDWVHHRAAGFRIKKKERMDMRNSLPPPLDPVGSIPIKITVRVLAWHSFRQATFKSLIIGRHGR